MAQNSAFEAGILESPNDAARYAVYGDWLQAQGDPPGELVSVQAALASTRDTKRFLELKQTESRLLATVTATVVPRHANQLELTWRYGFIHHVELRGDSPELPEVLTALLQHPAARFVQGVTLSPPATDQTVAVAALVKAAPPLLTRFELVHGAAPNLAAMGEAFPRLQHFVARGPESLSVPEVLLRWPDLRSLEVSTLGMTELLSRVLREAPWKRLRRVVLRPMVSGDRSPLIDDVAAVLALPDLRHIGISVEIEGVVAAIAKRPQLSTLLELDLFGFTSTARVEPLLARRDALRGLKLGIFQGELRDVEEKQLRAAVKGLALGEVEIYGNDEAGIHQMDPDEARSWREREERLANQSDYNKDDWN